MSRSEQYLRRGSRVVRERRSYARYFLLLLALLLMLLFLLFPPVKAVGPQFRLEVLMERVFSYSSVYALGAVAELTAVDSTTTKTVVINSSDDKSNTTVISPEEAEIGGEAVDEGAASNGAGSTGGGAGGSSGSDVRTAGGAADDASSGSSSAGGAGADGSSGSNALGGSAGVSSGFADSTESLDSAGVREGHSVYVIDGELATGSGSGGSSGSGDTEADASRPLPGHIFEKSGEGLLPQLVVVAPDDQDVFVKLKNPETGETRLSFYVRAGYTVKACVPAGWSSFSYAMGSPDAWAGTTVAFGKNGTYAKADRDLNFTNLENEYVYTFNVEDGNINPVTISQSAFA